MTNTSPDYNVWVDAVNATEDPNAAAKIALMSEYGARPLDKLEVNADDRYVIVSFKDSPQITYVFKYPDDEITVEEIETELHKIMHELTEENEEEILKAVFTLWLMNGRLSYFAQFTDVNMDASQSVQLDPEFQPND